jgi:cyclohexanecarboxyl-CoA dehydrogenase
VISHGVSRGERLSPHYQTREKVGVVDRDLIREMGSLGLMGVDLPESFGGPGAPGITAGIIGEELAYGDFNISAVPVGVSLLGAVIMSAATPALAGYWIPRMVSGETLMGVCVTEPSGGSDASALKLRCRRDGGYYILDGEKTSITFADCADAFIVFARTGAPESGAAGVTALIVPADTPGIARTRFRDVGSRIIGRGSVFFEGVRVPVENRLGQENRGFTHVMRGFDFSRALIALNAWAAPRFRSTRRGSTPKPERLSTRRSPRIRASRFRSSRVRARSPRSGNSLTMQSRFVTPAYRTPRRQRWSNGWGRRRRSTSSTSVC